MSENTTVAPEDDFARARRRILHAVNAPKSAKTYHPPSINKRIFCLRTSPLSSSLVFTFCLCCFGLFSARAQKVMLTGQIRDSTQQPVVYANIIATPSTTEEESTFAISDKAGRYKLMLVSGIPYKIAVSSLGFAPIKDTLKISKETVKNYTLSHSTTALEQVVVKAKMAMIVKKDTITYRVNQFSTGTERKLRDILEKLPGAEVDRQGNVTINGKKVTKLMVDGKDFFGGDVQLGVKNIPANAVEEIQAIDDYHEVAFMKGLSDSNKMAMNIKLKKGKKNFAFGDNEVGGGLKKRYYLHPRLFYYSPKTTANFIGSLNNINESPLDYHDIIRFRGGYNRLMDNPINSKNPGLDQFSGNGAILHKKTIFGAANFTRQLNKDLQLQAYSIVAQQKSLFKSARHTEYLTQEQLIEDRKTATHRDGFSNYNKIKLRYKPSFSKDLAYDVTAHVSNGSFSRIINSQIRDSLHLMNTFQDPHQVEISQYLRYNTQPAYNHTSEISAHYTYKAQQHLTHWDFNHPIFPDFIPIQNQMNRYHLFHDYSSITNTGRLNLKHYWVLNAHNHIYPKAGLYFYHQTYHSTDYQGLSNGHSNPFRAAGFDNALHYQLIDAYAGFQYKMKLGDFILRPGLVYHHYLWHANQFNHRITDRNKGFWAPEFKLEFEPDPTKELTLNYHLKSSFSGAADYANRLRLTGFNTLFRGNENLENAVYHDISASFRSFALASGINYYLRGGYRHQVKSIRDATVLEGINQINTRIYSHLPEDTYNFSGNVSKRGQTISAGVGGLVNFSDYTRIVNHQNLKYKGQVLAFRLSLRTLFDNLPNITAGLRQTFRYSQSKHHNTHYWALQPYVQLKYAFGGFILNVDYKYTYNKPDSKQHGQEFQMGNASLYYNAKGSPWGFEIRVNNLFDLSYKRSHYLNDFMIYDYRVYLQPRTVLFILSYRL